MKLHIDPTADALYLRLDESSIVESAEVSPGIVLDHKARNDVVGVEVRKRPARSGDPMLSAVMIEIV